MQINTLPPGMDDWAIATIRNVIEHETFEDAPVLKVRNTPNTFHYYVFLKDRHKDIPDKTHTQRLKDKLNRLLLHYRIEPQQVTAYRVPNEFFPTS